MANLVFQHAPNWATTSAAPGDTDWHRLTIPTSVPLASGNVNITCAVATMATSGTAAGGPVFVELNASGTPTVGFPVLGTLVIPKNTTIYYKLTTGTDTAYFAFSW